MFTLSETNKIIDDMIAEYSSRQPENNPFHPLYIPSCRDCANLDTCSIACDEVASCSDFSLC